jgi:uncharacterized RDD family membrane protein YckC
MNWHYADHGKQTGPVTDEQFAELVRNGTIQPDTLVWREGMAEWQPHRHIGTVSADTGTLAGEAPEAVCVECGKIFPVDQTIRYGNARVCAACKPLFLQKLAEGAQINTGELRYARILTRFAAILLDALILGAVNMGIGFLAGIFILGAARSQSAAPGLIAFQFVLFFIEMAIAVTYEGVMVGKYGATLGKMACKIKVVTADGGRVSYARAFGRYFGKLLSSLACLLGYIIACFDNPQKRALHDHLCNTRVVYR